MSDPTESLEDPKSSQPDATKPKRNLPNAWKAGRKPNPNSTRSNQRGSDRHGGKLAIRADPKIDALASDDRAYKKFSELVGGVQGLADIASYSDNPKAAKFLELVDDPRYRTYGIKALAKRCGMTLPELCNLFREKHFIETYLEFFAGVPQIAKGAVQDASPGQDVCPMCSGRKVRADSKDDPCPKCGGTGFIRVPGDKEARRDVFKAVGLIKDAPSIIGQQNIKIEGVEAFEDMMKNLKPTPIKGTVIDVEAEETEAE